MGFCGKVDVTISNTTTGATDKCVYPTQAAVCPALSNAYTLALLAGTTFNATPLSALNAGRVGDLHHHRRARLDGRQY